MCVVLIAIKCTVRPQEFSKVERFPVEAREIIQQRSRAFRGPGVHAARAFGRKSIVARFPGSIIVEVTWTGNFCLSVCAARANALGQRARLTKKALLSASHTDPALFHIVIYFIHRDETPLTYYCLPPAPGGVSLNNLFAHPMSA